MPTSKIFEITLVPAERDGAFITRSFCLTDAGKMPKFIVEALTIDELLARVATIANEHGEGCHAIVRCLEKRKPAGFDRRTGGLYYNLAPKEAS